MKKLLVGVLFVSITFSFTVKRYKIINPHLTTAAADSTTLNGLMLKDARAMVANFFNDNRSFHKHTSIWISKKWIDSVVALQNADTDFDGIRLYFAKYNNGRNTLVITATKSVALTKTHEDYFPTSSYFSSVDARVTDEYSRVKGANLYRKSPCSTGDTCGITDANSISCEDAYNAVTTFKKRALLQKSTINTDSEWFPKALFKPLQRELVAASGDGIRIYFGKYKNRHNLIIVTTQKVNNYSQDYYKCYSQFKANEIRDIKDHGEECPNNCNGVKLP